jgi:tRNA A37 threonylcarbamoyladenosine modification protein TsaB
MQGLAMAMGKPLIGVSAFDALAMLCGVVNPEEHGVTPQAGSSDGSVHVRGATRVAAWINAWRGEVFSTTYEDGRVLEAAVVARPENLLTRLTGRATVFTGDGAARHQELIRGTLGNAARLTDPVAPLLAGAIARLAGEAFRAGRCPPPHAIRALYVRRSDAALTGNAGPV